MEYLKYAERQKCSEIMLRRPLSYSKCSMLYSPEIENVILLGGIKELCTKADFHAIGNSSYIYFLWVHWYPRQRCSKIGSVLVLPGDVVINGRGHKWPGSSRPNPPRKTFGLSAFDQFFIWFLTQNTRESRPTIIGDASCKISASIEFISARYRFFPT